MKTSCVAAPLGLLWNAGGADYGCRIRVRRLQRHHTMIYMPVHFFSEVDYWVAAAVVEAELVAEASSRGTLIVHFVTTQPEAIMSGARSQRRYADGGSSG